MKQYLNIMETPTIDSETPSVGNEEEPFVPSQYWMTWHNFYDTWTDIVISFMVLTCFVNLYRSLKRKQKPISMVNALFSLSMCLVFPLFFIEWQDRGFWAAY